MNRLPALGLLLGLIAAAGSASAETPSLVNNIHPTFPFLDAEGRKVIESGLPMSTDTTCGNCHDAIFIDAHNSHHTDTVRASCLECHLPGGKLPEGDQILDENGSIKREFVTMREPTSSNCALCHGVVQTGQAPLVLPDDFDSTTGQVTGQNFYDLTKWTGEILSGQKMLDSHLNLAGKSARESPWDVHAARLVGCAACHYARNNPQKMELAEERLPFLVRDPRRLSISQYLYRPDHRFAKATCERCHEPLAVHSGLPYPKRHMQRLDCRSCHVPELMGPAWQTIDRTVLTPQGQPSVSYRGVTNRQVKHFSAEYLTGYRPYLLWQPGQPGAQQLAPYNLVTDIRWVSAESHKDVPTETLRAVYFDGESYSAEVMAALDTNRDGSLGPDELRLDTDAKVAGIRTGLVAAGVRRPEVQALVIPRKVHHGVQGMLAMSYACANCHSGDSRLSETVPLTDYAIPGAKIVVADEDKPLLSGAIEAGESGGLVYKRTAQANSYVLGYDRAPWSDMLGLAIFLFTMLGLSVHSALRVYNRRKHPPHRTPTKRVYLYSLYERIWHWLMAISVLLLVFTGIEIHWVNKGSLLGFTNAVWLHNLLAVVMIANAFLSLFYHLVSTDIRQFLPPRDSFVADVIAQAKYYLNGIFMGAPHPVAKTEARKLNALQQVTYMMLLNVLFPLQVITGLLMWGVSRWPGLSEAIGGLAVVTPLHNFGAWLLATFIVTHVYLTTTGHTLLSNIRAMATGYDEIELQSESERK